MPVKETKNPNLTSYTSYNKEPTPLETIKLWPWSNSETKGVGIFTGKPSGYVMVLDFDTKYDVTGNLYERWVELIEPELFERLVIAKTRSGGKHIYYRAPGSLTKNVKLANRHTTSQERDKNPNEAVKVLIETRGNGGVIVCSPTPAYSWLQGDQSTIPTITEAEELTLLAACRSFNEVVQEYQPKMYGTEYKISSALDPTEDYDNKVDVNGLLQSHGWEHDTARGSKDLYKRPGDTKAKNSGNYDHELKWFSVFSSSTQFETGKAYRPWMVYAVLEHNGDYKAAWQALKKAGYGKALNYDSRVINKIRLYLTAGNKKDADQYLDTIFAEKSTADSHLAKAQETILKIEGSFWNLTVDEKGNDKLTIDASALLAFMTRSGFFKHYPTGNIDPVFLRIKNGIAWEINSNQIIDFIADYIFDLPYEFDGITRTRLYNLVFHSSGGYFSNSKIEWLKENKREFIKDTNSKAFIFFNNGIVSITANEVRLTDYSALGDNIVWKHQVKDHDFSYEDPEGCEFDRFFNLVSTGSGDREIINKKILGYLIHTYKNPSKTYAIIAVEDIEDSDLGGGTGKSLIGVALSKMVPTTFMDGKTFDPSKGFAWQNYTLGDAIINIDDLGKKFSLEIINSPISAGFILERKNKPSVFIPASDSPKFFLSTNHVVDDSAAHAKRRIRKLIVTPFFSPNNTPFDYFGHLLFDDWSKSEWNLFYSFMIKMVYDYLKDPEIKSAESRTLIIKAFTGRYSSDLNDFLLNAAKLDAYKYKPGTVKNLSVMAYWYPNFLEFSGQDNKTYSMRRFSLGLKDAAENPDLFPTLKSIGGSRVKEYYFL